MHTTQFISHVDWTINTPFVSYSDNKYLEEIFDTNNHKAYIPIYESTSESEIIKHTNRHNTICQKISRMIKYIKRYNYSQRI
jgi:hypothetical protein